MKLIDTFVCIMTTLLLAASGLMTADGGLSQVAHDVPEGLSQADPHRRRY